ncbi:acyl-CoA thioesterase II [Sinimarinibacterium sp. NLF-5-8]|uniref:acyl-CoA thioesterase n=1 Tax=Sinimarinibacterium sp. NLF-5-8 TaxID=2698684 RepID=UPI00137C35CF|nr:thioesterase family protein [Sinimarinibacterium sp. NLF-5-8]QHS10215.1 thioesterase family protein [Sinimarinibacterium sp. NLF-5-8]
MTCFNQLLDAVHLDDDGLCHSQGHPDWTQGRTLFGGLQTALAVRVLRQKIGDALPLRSVQTTFMAPVPPAAFTLVPQILRMGGSTIHGECRIVSGDDVLCSVVAVFGKSRPSSIRIAPARPEIERDPDAAAELPFIDGLTPAFTQHFQLRWAQGGFPFTGAAQPRTRIHVRFRQPQTLTEAHLIALADTVPSPGLSVLKKPAMASSMTWTLELFDQRTEFAAQDWWRMDTVIDAAAEGYLGQSAHLWTPDGQLAALSRQTVVAFG